MIDSPQPPSSQSHFFNGWRIAGWSAALALLLLPAIAMRFTDEVNWTALDFVFAGVLIFSLGMGLEIAVRVGRGAMHSLGLAIAVLSDGLKGERIAKSIIFMPMAVSLVGASVIWRFMYIARDSAKTQTGVFNSLWVALGRLSTGDGLPTLIIGAIVTIIFGLLLVNIARNLARGEPARAAAPAVFAILVGWFLLRYWRITGTGVGGHRIKDDGTIVAQPINFIQDPPFNNFWLMIVLVWIQTGFAMVILSAAIRAVPTELIEAAKVDGATDSQVFWRVTLPQIGTTIGVVVTAIIVLVMKVFDIVKVMTNGNFGTEVLANNMFREAFSFGDTGIGAALAMLIFISVVPIMFLNIRRMQRES